MAKIAKMQEFNIFSFDTTIRNPQRNLSFLDIVEKIEGEFDEKNFIIYCNEAIGRGIYKPLNVSFEIKEKLRKGENLSESEVKKIMQDNPQKMGWFARAHTQFKALAVQMLVLWDKKRIYLSKIGKNLLKNPQSSQDIYTQIMLGLHFGSNVRKNANKARVFLNAIFTINLLKKEWANLGREAKGILEHECIFVLGMKDCDYEKCVGEILKYREKFGLKENKIYIENYIAQNGLKRLKYASMKDYVDEVFRKFQMTGLIIKRHNYYDFSSFECVKIEAILREFKNYKWQEFRDINEYIDFIGNIKLPWRQSDEMRKQIAAQKAKELNRTLKESDFSDLNALENSLNQEFSDRNLSEAVKNSDLNTLINELKILAGLNKKTQYKNLSEPLRLEYILALILGKKFDTQNLSSNLIYNENGEPISYAPAGKPDLEFKDFLLEATMIKNRNQQLNSETTSIARHMRESQARQNRTLRTMLIAPYVHFDVALFFKFCAKEFGSKFNDTIKPCKIAPLSINSFIKLLEKSSTFGEFQQNFDDFVKMLVQEETQKYMDKINEKNSF